MIAAHDGPILAGLGGTGRIGGRALWGDQRGCYHKLCAGM